MDNSRKIPCPEGFKIRVHHVHEPEELEFLAIDGAKGEAEPPPRYFTVAELFRVQPNGAMDKVDEAVARCSPRDVPNRRRGYLIAHNRVLVHYFGKAIKNNRNLEINNGLGQLL